MAQPEDLDVDRTIAALAARRGGVVARPDLLAAGCSRREIGRRIDGGRLFVIHRGVYAVGHPALTWHARAHAALLAVGGEAALSHTSAGIAYLLLPDDGGPIHVTVARRPPRQRPGIVVHEAKTLTIRHHQGLPVTTPARTLHDLATVLPLDALARALAEAQVLRLTTPSAIRSELGSKAARLRHLLDTTEPTRSELERALTKLIRQAGLPRPRTNTRVGPYQVDAYWPAERVIVEVDGWAAHGHRAAFERDRARDADLQARGCTVIRFTWRQVMHEPLRVATRIAQVLARA